MALLPEAVVDTIKAHTGWLTIYETKDVPALRNTAMQAVSNTNKRLYTSLHVTQSTKTTFSLNQQNIESAHTFYERCITAFQAHTEAGHGWSVGAHYKEAIAPLAYFPNYDQSS